MIDRSHFFANGTIPSGTVVFSAFIVCIEIHETIATLTCKIRLAHCFALYRLTLGIFKTFLVFKITVAIRKVDPRVYIAPRTAGRNRPRLFRVSISNFSLHDTFRKSNPRVKMPSST